MKTPEEIKKGLETCIGECRANKPHCPYHTCGNGCMDTMNKDALAYIQQLESRLAQVEKERDAAIVDIIRTKHCPVCVHYIKRETEEPCKHCINNTSKLDWRGVCAENTEEEN